METGMIKNLSHKDYLAIDRVSNSYLTKLAQVPACTKVPTVETAAMTFGTAFHTYVLEQNQFADKVEIMPKIDKRTKDGKAAYAEFIASAEGKTVIGIDDFVTIRNMKEAIQRHPRASLLLSEGIAESSIFWTDPETGIECKARPDFLTPSGVVVDLKKTRGAAPHSFLQSVLNFRYFLQAAFYLDGINQIDEIEYNRFAFIAAEADPPYRVEVYELDLEFIDHGYRECRRLLKLEAECREAEFYPHYQDPGIIFLHKPAYLK